MAAPTASLPSVISETSDPSRSISPAELQADNQPVKRLRKDQKTSTAADQLIKDIGYIPSQGNSSSDSSPADGLWPEDYVDRLTGNDPTFDSLKLTELISGYISIMEETLPRGVDLPAFLVPEKLDGGLFRSGLGDSQDSTQTGVVRHSLPSFHLD